MTARTGRRPSAVPSPAPHRSSATPGSVDRAGFTLLELLLVITMAAILMAIGSRGARVLPREPMEERIARTILGEISVARTYAIRANVPVSLVIDESNRLLPQLYRRRNQRRARGTSQPSERVISDHYQSGGTCVSQRLGGQLTQ